MHTIYDLKRLKSSTHLRVPPWKCSDDIWVFDFINVIKFIQKTQIISLFPSSIIAYVQRVYFICVIRVTAFEELLPDRLTC